jgi:sugar (pentulose or hexulose) kinase
VLVVPDIRRAVATTRAQVVQVGNLAPQVPETEGLDGVDHLRAVLEHGAMPAPDRVVTVGGGARSPLWCQIIADVTGSRLEVPRIIEAGALGAAMHAAVGLGLFPDLQTAAQQVVRRERVHAPDARAHNLYSHLHQLWLDLEERVQAFYGQLELGSSTRHS